MKHVTLLKKICNGRVNYEEIEVNGCVLVLVEIEELDMDDVVELNFDSTPIGEVVQKLLDYGLFENDCFWKWGGTQSPDESILVVSTPKGDADFIDFARFVEWVRVFAEADSDDCDDIDCE